MLNTNFADEWIQTADLWCRKRPLTTTAQTRNCKRLQYGSCVRMPCLELRQSKFERHYRPSHFPNYLLEKTNIKPKEACVGPCLIRSTLLQSNKLVSSKYVTSFNIVTSSVCDVFNVWRLQYVTSSICDVFNMWRLQYATSSICDVF